MPCTQLGTVEPATDCILGMPLFSDFHMFLVWRSALCYQKGDKFLR
jgi:hypothetical protein